MKVLQTFLSGYTQEHPELPLGLAALAGGWEELAWSAVEWAELLSYQAESGVGHNPLNPYVQFS